MFSTTTSGALLGLTCYMTQVEVDCSRGLPMFEMVGSLSSDVREAKERVRVALKNAGIQCPPMRITINLSPANIRKEGTAFDLPIAIGVLRAMEMLPNPGKVVLLGELGLNGQVKPVKGVLPVVMQALECGYESCIVPYDNYREGAAVGKIRVMGVRTLTETLEYIKADDKKRRQLENQVCNENLIRQENRNGIPKENIHKISEEKEPDFAEMCGQEGMKRAAVIAAAGFHHLLMVGPPGSGKTMLAQRMPSILPEMVMEEQLEVSKIHSIAGVLQPGVGLVKQRPYFHPHHTATVYAMAGGGVIPHPGLISLSHHGILFLDELPEFRREVLEILRQPLEDKVIQIARSGGNYLYPADFLLIAAMNPCPCGYFPDRNRCHCTDSEIRKYTGRISGPILSRIDLCVHAPKMELEQLTFPGRMLDSKTMKNQVERARKIQMERYKGTNLLFNSQLRGEDIAKYCSLTEEATNTLELLFHEMQLGARNYHKVIKTARTIADLMESPKIDEEHILEAAMYQERWAEN